MDDFMIDKPTVLSRLKEWLAHHGYPLEMRVASALQAKGFDVSLSDFYYDFEEDKRREIDVTATKAYYGPGVELLVSLAIECKLSQDKPWVVFMADAQDEEWFPPTQALANTVGSEFLDRLDRDDSLISRLNDLPLLAPQAAAHSITQAFRANSGVPDVPYQACLGAVSAAIHAASPRHTKAEDEEFDPFTVFSIVFPVVVVSGSLFETRLDSTGETAIAGVERTTLRWKGLKLRGLMTTSIPIQIVTEHYLSEFCDAASRTADTLIELAKANVQALVQIARDKK